MRLTSGLTLLSVASLGAGTPAARAATATPEPGLARDLAEASTRTVWFAHQSVGANVIEGLAGLAARTGAPLRLVEGPPDVAGAPGTWAHAYVGENGAPRSKLDAFVRSLDEAGRGPDVALLKLCYVDFHEGTDPAALLEAYRTALAGLQIRHPRTTFVHVTVPLTAPDRWPRALAKRLLGREGSAARNARRERYNALLRDAYAGREPLFDLAALEARCPDGIPATEPWRGREVPALCPAYTDDGGHLNAAGRERAARALLAIVAAVPAPTLPAPTEARGWTR